MSVLSPPATPTHAPNRPSFGVPTVPVRRFTVSEYHRLIELGIVREEEAVELISGWITPKMPHTPLDDMTVDRIPDLLRPIVSRSWRFRCQLATAIDRSQPEPDIAVVREPATRYAKSHPEPADISMLIEVSASSLSFDRHTKSEIYSMAGIARYWIVNLVERQIEVHSDPLAGVPGGGYRAVEIYRPGDHVPVVIEGEMVGQIAVDDILPPS